ncbi:MAG TPA: hypothetical protein VHE83_05250 [Mycobacteriales bacterium]|nr:hypothetical protein [Mycobacteriales bacterium]
MAVITQEQRAVLESGPQHMYLFVNAGDAAPVGYPMTAFWADEAVHFTTYRAARKTARLLADDRVCCLFAPCATEPAPDRVLLVQGRATLADSDVIASRAADLDATGRPLPVPPDVQAKVARRLDAGKRVVFAVAVEDAAFVPVPTQEATWRVRI